MKKATPDGDPPPQTQIIRWSDKEDGEEEDEGGGGQYHTPSHFLPMTELGVLLSC